MLVICLLEFNIFKDYILKTQHCMIGKMLNMEKFFVMLVYLSV
jgi:hypothetical protein